MNYFAHGYRYVDDPYFLAGTAVPDWLSAVDRKVRVRPKDAEAQAEHAEAVPARVARGVARHHADDARFHVTPAFAELSWGYALQLRRLLPADDGLRPGFLGHIVVELLLDAVLIDEHPGRIEAYYAALASVDVGVVEEAVNRMATARTERLSIFIPVFTRERFLCDYGDDVSLLRRLNQVMRRVGLEPLPERLLDWLPDVRREVADRRRELLPDAW